MAEFEISGPARQDLREIYDWVAQDDPAAADQVLSDLRDAARTHPDAGRAGPQRLPRHRFDLLVRLLTAHPDGANFA